MDFSESHVGNITFHNNCQWVRECLIIRKKCAQSYVQWNAIEANSLRESSTSSSPTTDLRDECVNFSLFKWFLCVKITFWNVDFQIHSYRIEHYVRGNKINVNCSSTDIMRMCKFPPWANNFFFFNHIQPLVYLRRSSFKFCGEMCFCRLCLLEAKSWNLPQRFPINNHWFCIDCDKKKTNKKQPIHGKLRESSVFI